MATLEDHEARIAALEAAQADYRAVLAAVNALGVNQREHTMGLNEVKSDMAEVKADVAELKASLVTIRQENHARFRSSEEHLAELKDLIIAQRDG